MHFTTSAAVASLMAFASMANAHMMMAMPKPFPGTISSPVQDLGANYICQGKLSGGSPMELKIGSKNNKITFAGTAVHGGGSCQVAITYKEKPTATDFRVITSFHGGCPMENGNENLMPADAAKPLDSGLTYDVPEGIPGGNAILAWTWINKIGNREFYMQCAPIKLTGTPGSKAALEKLPSIATPNIPGSGCDTQAQGDFSYEFPGPVVRIGHSRPMKVLKGCKVDKGTGGGGGGGGGGGSDAAPAPEPPKEDKPASPPPATPPPAANLPPPANPPASGGGGEGGSCTDGTFNCIEGGTKYQQCAHGKWQATMSMAPGTTCKPGVSTTLFKRSVDRLHVRDFGHMEMVWRGQKRGEYTSQCNSQESEVDVQNLRFDNVKRIPFDSFSLLFYRILSIFQGVSHNQLLWVELPYKEQTVHGSLAETFGSEIMFSARHATPVITTVPDAQPVNGPGPSSFRQPVRFSSVSRKGPEITGSSCAICAGHFYACIAEKSWSKAVKAAVAEGEEPPSHEELEEKEDYCGSDPAIISKKDIKWMETVGLVGTNPNAKGVDQ
uniref:Endoglucanase n=1 Tax=Pyricularia oryzae (strain P131) TaxID=1143193 RepID=L7J042_PYRO1